MIRENAETFSVGKMCQVFSISRSGYYDWLHRQTQKTKRQLEDESLSEHIRQIYYDNKRRYGVPRIYNALKQKEIHCGKNRVARLMKKEGLAAWRKKSFKRTTNSNHNHPVAPNLLNRDFNTSRPNQAWVSDITYIPTLQGWLYLATIIDLYSRKVVGWAMSERLGKEIVISAIKMAIKNRRPSTGLIVHSDRGVQYASNEFQKILKRNKFRCSMSRKGNCWDNAPAESFFSSLKQELMYEDWFKTRQEARLAIFEFIEIYYNKKRMHSTLSYMTPEEYENKRKSA